jgi:hypothetical protein
LLFLYKVIGVWVLARKKLWRLIQVAYETSIILIED